jgi:hypothetical protein
MHSPPTGGSGKGQLSQSVAFGPEQVAHDASHGVHSASVTVVHAALSNSFAVHVVQLWHEVLPVTSVYVPPAHVRQLLLAGAGW